MAPAQPGILDDTPPQARYVSFTFATDAPAAAALPDAVRRLASAADGKSMVVGFGPSLVSGSYLWCPPMVDNHLDLRQLGL